MTTDWHGICFLRFRFFIGVFLDFPGLLRAFSEMFRVFLGVFRVSGGIPGFESVPECSVMFRCSGSTTCDLIQTSFYFLTGNFVRSLIQPTL